MERTNFVDPTVVREAAGVVLLRDTMTADNYANHANVAQDGVVGVPTMVFIDAHGTVRSHRVGLHRAGRVSA